MQRMRSAWSGGERTTVAGDQRAAFATLSDLNLASAYRLAGVILGDPLEAEDATHDSVIKAWRRYGSLRDPSRFEAWFQRILVNICRDRLRRRRRWPLMDIDLAAEPVGGQDAYARVDDRLALDRAFEALSPDQRLAVVLRFYADLTVDEIAHRTGVPAGTVKSRLHTATERLHHALRAERETPS
jgi:RNA polymerase sigma-70 factor (ECF subfamily)